MISASSEPTDHALDKARAPSAATEVRLIEPVRGFSIPGPRMLIRNADLLYFLGRRDVAVRYKQTAIGLLWVVIQPAILAVVFSVFLNGVAKVPSGAGVPYPVFAVTGLTLWIAFTMILSRTSNSVVESINLVSKVFFPRILIPIAATLAPLVDFVLAFFLSVVLMFLFGITPSPRIFLVFIPAAIMVGLALGTGLWFAALNVRYRDVAVAVPAIVQVGLFVTPIIYPANLVPDNLRNVYALNPLVGTFESFRYALFPGAATPGLTVVYSAIAAVVLLVTGAAYFQRAQANFADYI